MRLLDRQIETHKAHTSRRHLLKATLAGASILLTACGASAETGSAQATPDNSETSETATASGYHKAIGAKVCNVFFTQKTEHGMLEVIGRPVVGKNNMPMDVLASPDGVKIEAHQQKSNGEVAWYSIYGDELPNGLGDESCKIQTIHSVKRVQEGSDHPVSWVATTNNTSVPEHWDAVALDPAGFGGTGLDYGPVSVSDFNDIRKQASQLNGQ